MEPERFAYHRGIAPMLGVLLGLALCEAVVVHIVAMALWGWPVALALAGLDLALILFLLRLMRSFRRLPILLDGSRLTLRTGSRLSVTLDIDRITGFRTSWDAAALKRKDVLNMALIAWPNLVMDIDPPLRLRRRRIISTIAHRLDDPAAFHAAIARLERRHGDHRI